MILTDSVKNLYSLLLEKIKPFGNIIVEEKKTSFHIKNKSAFAGVHPRKEYLILNIVSDTPLKSSRIFKTEHVSKSRFHNETKIEKAEDINEELINWLKSAYILMG